MKSYSLLATICVIGVLSASNVAHGQPSTGYIENSRGEPCAYIQELRPDSNYFYSKVTANTWTLTFVESRCMAGSDSEISANIALINRVIGRWYSHADADFAVHESELYPGSLFQERGGCMQSRKYSNIGVALAFVIKDGTIEKVRHAGTIQGCRK